MKTAIMKTLGHTVGLFILDVSTPNLPAVELMFII
jgi:hypothetical protein